jgi:hypothetical protein
MLPEHKNNSVSNSPNLPKISADDLSKLTLGMSHISCTGKDYRWEEFYGNMEFNAVQKHTIREKGRKLEPISYEAYLELDEVKGLDFYLKNKSRFLDLGSAKIGTVVDKGTKKELIVINLPLLVKVVEASTGEKVDNID